MTEENTDTEGQLLAGKYKTPQDLEKAYIALQKKLGEPRSAPDVAPVGGKPAEFDADGSGVVAKKMAEFNTALARLNAGDPSALPTLIALGGDPQSLRRALGVAQDMQKRALSLVHGAAGGKEAFESLNQWVNESPEVESFQRDAYEDALASGDLQRSTEAVKHMAELHRNHTGYTPSQLTVSVPGGGPKRVAPYSDTGEVGRATSDPRYDRTSPRHDPAYAAEVQARMQISPCLDPGFASDVQSRNA